MDNTLIPEVILDCDDIQLREQGKRVFGRNNTSSDDQKAEVLRKILDRSKRRKLDQQELKRQENIQTWESFFSSYWVHLW